MDIADILFQELIDYAGLFPPASLSIPESLTQYHQFKKNEFRRLSRNFVAPTSKLSEIADELIKFQPPFYLPVSAVGSKSSDRQTWEDGLSKDADLLNQFREKCGSFGDIVAFETKVPFSDRFSDFARDLSGFAEVDLYVEIELNDQVQETVASAADFAERSPLFLKARLGGETAAAFPSSEIVASFIQSTSQLDIPFKLTAGLHQPWPHFDSEIGAKHHGFINILIAVGLAHEEDIPQEQIIEILDQGSIENIKFEKQKIITQWGDLDIGAVEALRDVIDSIGSCSLIEPLEGIFRSGISLSKSPVD